MLIHFGLSGEELLLDRPRMESLSRCRRLLGGNQSLRQLFDLPIFHFKLPLQRVDGGL